MGAIITTAVFLVGLAIAIVCAMLSTKRKNFLWHMPTVIYAVLWVAALNISDDRPFDYTAMIFFAVALVVLGWLTAWHENRR